MDLDFTTRLSDTQTATEKNATVLASLTEILSAIDSGAKPNKVNFHQYARLYGTQFVTTAAGVGIDGDRFGEFAKGFGIPNEAFVNQSLDDVGRASASLSHRSFQTSVGSRGTRGLMAGTRTGILRGRSYVIVASGASTGTRTIDWTNAGPPETDASEANPGTWTAPLTIERLYCCPFSTNGTPHGSGSYYGWVNYSDPIAGHTAIAQMWTSTAPGATGFTVTVQHHDWTNATDASAAYVAAADKWFEFVWVALVKHAA